MYNFTATDPTTGTNSDGAEPQASLIISGNKLYGTTYGGGSSGGGTVFAVNTNGTGFTNLHSFTGGSDGTVPVGLILWGNEPPEFDYSKPIPEFFRFKSKCYKYEGEYRIIRPLSECAKENREKDTVLYFRPLPRRAIKAVYLGHRIKDSTREAVIHFLHDTGVKVFEMESNRDGYELSFKTLK